MVRNESTSLFRMRDGLLLGVSAIFGAAVILSNPVAVGLPIAGTLSVIAMMMSIDRMNARLSRTADTTAESAPSRSA